MLSAIDTNPSIDILLICTGLCLALIITLVVILRKKERTYRSKINAQEDLSIRYRHLSEQLNQVRDEAQHLKSTLSQAELAVQRCQNPQNTPIIVQILGLPLCVNFCLHYLLGVSLFL